ncbi:MAG: thymidylate kinase [Fusobacteria bacterium]|nr:thymidylate kinase [Fusobacteriota bacterium]
MGKLIVIESGVDGSGKQTQTEKIYNRLIKENYKIKKVQFPNYESDASSLIKMYLNGDFGKNANSVNPYTASTFYAVDRYASYKKDWENFYNEGGIILSDRYTTSNMIHQGSKISHIAEKIEYLDWLNDLEFNKIKLPKPDLVFFLDLPLEYSLELTKNRKNKINGDIEKDIHEKDIEYLKDTYENGCFLAEKYKWEKISCILNGKLREIDDIHNEIYLKLKKYL